MTDTQTTPVKECRGERATPARARTKALPAKV
eukprot:CAMPEP_0181234510 /NCGR_PEP_ID=MMETSP1096-20121128/37015_1 /TAXON_ID=156174 ORGANISM="Chrysochromulina ericina, Strain CCMP281" /NCGR_SAMPLE_ID=MMETSP1096 /ASSEMBLY_ACC=CAM_ASM_000453 /LENGTH=31 /DNA_ID= /DNA_START= /DNA_END= /DNA_ORIENTATION=